MTGNIHLPQAPFVHVHSPLHHAAPLPCGHSAQVAAWWLPQDTMPPGPMYRMGLGAIVGDTLGAELAGDAVGPNVPPVAVGVVVDGLEEGDTVNARQTGHPELESAIARCSQPRGEAPHSVSSQRSPQT